MLKPLDCSSKHGSLQFPPRLSLAPVSGGNSQFASLRQRRCNLLPQPTLLRVTQLPLQLGTHRLTQLVFVLKTTDANPGTPDSDSAARRSLISRTLKLTSSSLPRIASFSAPSLIVTLVLARLTLLGTHHQLAKSLNGRIAQTQRRRMP